MLISRPLQVTSNFGALLFVSYLVNVEVVRLGTMVGLPSRSCASRPSRNYCDQSIVVSQWKRNLDEGVTY